MYTNTAILFKRIPQALDDSGHSILSPDTTNVLIGSDGYPMPPPKPNNAPLVLLVSGFMLLFCIYLYFLISPIAKDNNCVAPHSSGPYLQSPKDSEKGHPAPGEPEPTKPETADNCDEAATDMLEKKRLRNWIQGISHGRFFIIKDISNRAHHSPKPKPEMDKIHRFQRCPSNSESPTQPRIEVTPPPPAYASPATPNRQTKSAVEFHSSSSTSEDFSDIHSESVSPLREETPQYRPVHHRTTSSTSILSEKSGRYPDFRQISDNQRAIAEPMTNTNVQIPRKAVVRDSTPGLSGGRIRRIIPRVF